MSYKVLVTVVGPTAIGKTKLAIVLAKYYNTEIISADSRQFYKELTIGTAVPSKKDLAVIPHHFIQNKSIFHEYTVGDFEREALQVLEQLFKNRDIVIMVGGSGLYLESVIKGLDDFPEVDPHIRAALNKTFSDSGIKVLQNQLQQLDPGYYDKVDLENPHRLIRALEICLASGKPYSSFLNKKKPLRPFKTISVGITADRPLIYERIRQRVDQMMDRGLLDEAKSLKEYKMLNALQTVGYRELFDHFEGKWDLDFAISEIKKNTRRFAKRQLTWFRKNENTFWIDYNAEINEVIGKIEQQMK